MDMRTMIAKAKELLGKHDDKVDKVIDKGSEHAKRRFAGHDEQVDKLSQKAKDYDFSGGQASGTPSAPRPAAESGNPPPPSPERGA